MEVTCGLGDGEGTVLVVVAQPEVVGFTTAGQCHAVVDIATGLEEVTNVVRERRQFRKFSPVIAVIPAVVSAIVLALHLRSPAFISTILQHALSVEGSPAGGVNGRVVLEDVETFSIINRALCGGCGGVTAGIVVLVRRQERHILQGNTAVDIHAGVALAGTFLAGDDHHTVGGTLAVEGSGSRAFQYAEALYVVHDDGRLVCDRSVHHEDRGDGTQTGHTPDQDARVVIGGTGGTHQLNAGHFTREGRAHVHRTGEGQVLPFYFLDGITQCFFLALDTEGRYDHLVQ